MAGGESRSREPVGIVVPGDWQFTAQQRRAALTAGVSPCSRAFAQQSMPSIIPGILHSRSPACSGMPATALPPTTASKIRDVSHLVITEKDSIKGPGRLSRCRLPMVEIRLPVLYWAAGTVSEYI